METMFSMRKTEKSKLLRPQAQYSPGSSLEHIQLGKGRDPEGVLTP